MSEWIDRTEALAALKVRPQTLYAYVSRGRIGMRPDPADPRRSLYRADDIAALLARRSRRSSAAIAASTLAWGEPAIATAISTIDRGRLIYRGIDAVALAGDAAAEQVAALLWQTKDVAFPAGQSVAPADDPFSTLAALIEPHGSMLGRSAERLQSEAAICIAALARCFGTTPGPAALHERLAQGWSGDAAAARTIRMALVLLADHELNASTFAARVAASTGSSMAASLLAGLCTLSGPRHGGAGEALLALLREAESVGSERTVSSWLARGPGLPGFGHPLYPGGDPRAMALLEDVTIDRGLADLRDVAAAITGCAPNIDFALAAISRAHGLPQDAPFRLFAIGRAIGWAAHAMEQVAQGGLIRPRGRYEGVVPLAKVPAGDGHH